MRRIYSKARSSRGSRITETSHPLDSTRQDGSTPARPNWPGIIALALLTAITAWLALRTTRFEGVAAVWVSNGLLTGALLLTPVRTWAWWFMAGFLGQLAARWLVGDTPLQTIGLAVVNLVECAIVAGWIRRHDRELKQAPSLGEVSRNALLSTLVACAISASLALPIVLTRPGTSALAAWSSWYSAHVLGMVIVATLLVGTFLRRSRLFGAPGRRLDFAICLALLLMVCAVAFGQERYSLVFLVFLPLLLLSFRHGLSGMVIGILVVAVISGITAARGHGAFALAQDSSALAHLFYWQLFTASACLLSYSTAVAMTSRRQLERRVLASQAQLQAITDNLPALAARFDRDVRYTYANPRSRATAGDTSLIGKTLQEVRGEEYYAELHPHVEAVLRGEPQEFETWIDSPEGRMLLRAHFMPDLASDGSVQGFYSMSFDITAAKAAERELERLARVDPLTGLANRRHFEADLEAAVARAVRTRAPLLVVALDLDRFKQINDTRGHAVGDEVLKEFAKRLRASVYDVDLVARLGGDEFAVLVEFTPTREAGERIARYLLEAMEPPFLVGGEQVAVAASIGLGLQQPVRSAAALMELADKALYEAKARGRNTWALCESL